ncbi:protein of unknown function [Denitratisoma oestradiolicum]|uniref:Uncharacterized protein n=1 Tax=Denitratisoma oestradiolicum TaxID=311182 RepID=A0A6S6XYQ3_9PROT|nr:protein of unknown function [Denitratisoma oestradiolicum]
MNTVTLKKFYDNPTCDLRGASNSLFSLNLVAANDGSNLEKAEESAAFIAQHSTRNKRMTGSAFRRDCPCPLE